MLARIRKSMENREEGFTLIELLVVVIIIGILAAIAIPVFLNQRKKAVDASVKSDLKSIADAQETYSVDHSSDAIPYTLTVGSTGLADVKKSSGNSFKGYVSANGYCLEGYNTSGTANTAASKAFWYDSSAGGLQSGAAGSAPSGGVCAETGATMTTISIP